MEAGLGWGLLVSCPRDSGDTELVAMEPAVASAWRECREEVTEKPQTP